MIQTKTIQCTFDSAHPGVTPRWFVLTIRLFNFVVSKTAKFEKAWAQRLSCVTTIVVERLGISAWPQLDFHLHHTFQEWYALTTEINQVLPCCLTSDHVPLSSLTYATTLQPLIDHAQTNEEVQDTQETHEGSYSGYKLGRRT